MLTEYHSGIDKTEKTINDFLEYLNQKLNRDIAYSIRMEVGVQTCDKTLELALGSCRDSGWLLVQVLRQLGLAARFVSGYLVQLTANTKSLDGPSGPENDFTDLHAWAEVYVPGAGWIGLDPTSGLFAGEGHIPLACTPHYASAAPVVGATDKTETTFSFSNTVSRIHEDPRVTKPYSDEQWLSIQALGYKVDEDLKNGDVRMTMGGEPTFVSIDDMEGEEWNTAADGKHKRLLAHDLIFRLREQFGPQGMLHYGEGKWYLGEPLPRWQYGLFWRKDGYPIWQKTHLVAHERIEKKYTHEHAEKYIHELAKHLAVSEDNVSTAYEDVFYMMWAEGRLPVNIDVMKASLKDPLERQTIAQVFEKGLDAPAGYVLPLRWNYDSSKWQSNKWALKRGHLFIIPGNSPMGLRLPLDSLPAIAEKDEPKKVERSLFDELPGMPHYHETIKSRYGQVSEHRAAAEKMFQNTTTTENYKSNGQHKENETGTTAMAETAEHGVIKTALCIEIREGVIYLFLPPIDYLENYLDLVASIEATSEKLNLPVRIEGYEPPRDYRLQRLVVTPDPGVIEVNIHSSKNWKELIDNIDT